MEPLGLLFVVLVILLGGGLAVFLTRRDALRDLDDDWDDEIVWDDDLDPDDDDEDDWDDDEDDWDDDSGGRTASWMASAAYVASTTAIR